MNAQFKRMEKRFRNNVSAYHPREHRPFIYLFVGIVFFFGSVLITQRFGILPAAHAAKGEDPVIAHAVNLYEGMTLRGVNYTIVGSASKGTDFVEVSTNGGKTFWRARKKGKDQWVYYWSFYGPGKQQIVIRARNNDGPEGKSERVNVKVQMPNRLTLVQDVLIDDFGIKTFPEKDMDKFFSDLSKHFNVVEVHFWNGFWKEETIKRAQKVIDTAHKHGMRVAVSVWEYPSDDESSPWWYHAHVLDDATGRTRDVVNKIPFSQPTLDRSNPFAMRYMFLKYREQLKRLRDVDYVFFNEDLLQKWSEPWPSLKTPYDDSPTYTWMALESFRTWMVERHGEKYAFRKLPVRDKKYVNEFTELTNDTFYWKQWQEWRQDVFAYYIQGMAKQGYEAYKGNPNFHGTIYFQWQTVLSKDEHGVDLTNISQYPEQNIAMFVVEHAEALNKKGIEDSARFVAEICKKYRKSFGGFVSFYRYFNSEHTPLDVVQFEFEIAVKYNAQMITSFNAQTFYTASPLYNADTVKLWDNLVKNHIFLQ